jgi:O-glycosyl hydrolase
MASAHRALTLILTAVLLVVGSATDVARSTGGPWEETRFRTGCDPGPYHPPSPPEHRETHYPPLDNSAEPVSLRVDLSSAGTGNGPAILGSGFNLEHALWSCAAFRAIFRSEILDPFKPAIARVDTGLLPAAPASLQAQDLGPAVYESVLSSAPYADSWRFFRRLNRAGVRIILGVWGGPAQFTRDGSRLGVLEPSHYDDYVDYVATVVEFIVRSQGIQVWATTIANEPDGGDGNQIAPDGLAYIAHRLAPRLAALGVKLYGPDTANGDDALQYLPLLLDDPVIADNLAFIGFHQYYPSLEAKRVVDYVRGRRADLPVIITEYTSFGFGDLDDGQEANAQNGFTLDIASMLLSHYRNGIDAALYWDAVDYLQPGHDAVTRWGFLRGPLDDFQRRQRYYGMEQILPYLQPGARVLDDQQSSGDTLNSLSIRTAEGVPAVFLVNQDFGPLDLTLIFTGADVSNYPSLVVTQTDRGHRAERLGRLHLQDGVGQLMLSPRSITTLFPAGAGPQVDDAV